MKTASDVIDILWSLLNASPLKTAINGGVYKMERPLNSNVEDVVINTLPVNFLQLQTGLANVNVFVPNLLSGGESKPNTKRLKELSLLAVNALKDVWSDDYHLEVQQQTLIKDEESNQYFINIRVDFFNINTN